MMFFFCFFPSFTGRSGRWNSLFSAPCAVESLEGFLGLHNNGSKARSFTFFCDSSSHLHLLDLFKHFDNLIEIVFSVLRECDVRLSLRIDMDVSGEEVSSKMLKEIHIKACGGGSFNERK
jgi:hypothetical protein